MSNLKEFMLEKLKERYKTQTFLANKLNISIPYLNQMLSKKRNIPVWFNDKVSKILDFNDYEHKKLKSLSEPTPILNISNFREKDKSFLITIYKHIESITDQEKKEFLKKII